MPEYALRRALGARRRHIVAHALAESAVPGLIGGLAGASLGVAIVVLVALADHWTPVIAPILLWPAPFAGAAAAMIAWLIPATVAALASRRRTGSTRSGLNQRAGVCGIT